MKAHTVATKSIAYTHKGAERKTAAYTSDPLERIINIWCALSATVVLRTPSTLRSFLGLRPPDTHTTVVHVMQQTKNPVQGSPPGCG